jgi:hypothetical protein
MLIVVGTIGSVCGTLVSIPPEIPSAGSSGILAAFVGVGLVCDPRWRSDIGRIAGLFTLMGTIDAIIAAQMQSSSFLGQTVDTGAHVGGLVAGIAFACMGRMWRRAVPGVPIGGAGPDGRGIAIAQVAVPAVVGLTVLGIASDERDSTAGAYMRSEQETIAKHVAVDASWTDVESYARRIAARWSNVVTTSTSEANLRYEISLDASPNKYDRIRVGKGLERAMASMEAERDFVDSLAVPSSLRQLHEDLQLCLKLDLLASRTALNALRGSADEVSTNMYVLEQASSDACRRWGSAVMETGAVTGADMSPLAEAFAASA